MSQRWSTSRVEAFSDGVFAIAITLLVLEIKIEPDQFEHLWRALADEWPAYLAYVTSFFTIGGVWLAHHGLFSRLEAIDPVLMRMNILLLMAVSFLPFPTALMAESLKASESAERAAVIVYGGVAGACAASCTGSRSSWGSSGSPGSPPSATSWSPQSPSFPRAERGGCRCADLRPRGSPGAAAPSRRPCRLGSVTAPRR